MLLKRGRASIAAAGLAAIGGLLATGGLVAGAQAKGPSAGGLVHVYEYDPPTNVPGTIILTGAIADHGQDRAGVAGPHHTYNKLVLTKGSFEVNVGKIKIHQHLDKTSCTLVVHGSGPVPVVKGSGTGAYQGITGTSRAKDGFIGVFPRKPNGSCNMNASPVAGWGWANAVGRFSVR